MCHWHDHLTGGHHDAMRAHLIDHWINKSSIASRHGVLSTVMMWSWLQLALFNTSCWEHWLRDLRADWYVTRKYLSQNVHLRSHCREDGAGKGLYVKHKGEVWDEIWFLRYYIALVQFKEFLCWAHCMLVAECESAAAIWVSQCGADDNFWVLCWNYTP